MDQRFLGDTNLAHILKWYGWALYDITAPSVRIEPFSWDEIDMRDQAEHYQISHRYYLLPIPQEGESIKKAYAKSKKEHTFPILRIPKEERRYTVIAEDGFRESGFNCYYLNEFYFQEAHLRTFCPIWANYHSPSRITIPSKEAVEVFSQYFSLVQFIDGKIEFKGPLQKYVD